KDGRQIDFLSFLELGIDDADPLLTAVPDENATYDGKQCVVYRAELQAKPSSSYPEGVRDGVRRIQIEAFANPQSHQLLGIVAHAGGGPPSRIPLAERQLVAINPPVDESKFVVAKTLTDDGHIGIVTDAQGLIVAQAHNLQTFNSDNWRKTPIGTGFRLRRGDEIRTDIRGADAVKLRLVSGIELALGPGTRMQLESPSQSRPYHREGPVVIPKQDEACSFTMEYADPSQGDKRSFHAPGKYLLRIDRNEKLVDVTETPKWLSGFEGTSANESLGSLIVNLPDGRNEPLTIG